MRPIPSISPGWCRDVRAISAITPLIPESVREFVPTADDLDPDAQYILDGTLLPCWSWDGHKELYSGKHKTTGMNIQAACTIYGKLAWISDPVDGSRHDNYCQKESGVLLTMNPEVAIQPELDLAGRQGGQGFGQASKAAGAGFNAALR